MYELFIIYWAYLLYQSIKYIWSLFSIQSHNYILSLFIICLVCLLYSVYQVYTESYAFNLHSPPHPSITFSISLLSLLLLHSSKSYFETSLTVLQFVASCFHFILPFSFSSTSSLHHDRNVDALIHRHPLQCYISKSPATMQVAD